MKTKILLPAIIILFLLPSTYAQVTIGSELPPLNRAILDLKEYATQSDNSNSGKGLGLPRVALSSLTKLTVDDDNKSNDYVGLTVYNITNNMELSEGTYCWFGSGWKQVILVDDVGADGNYLKMNNDNKYSWSNISLPAYKFWKPTQKVVFDNSKATPVTGTYDKIVYNNGTSPEPGFFNDKFAYEEIINIKTSAGSERFLLIELTANITKKTIGNLPAKSSFYEELQIEILLNDSPIKTYKRIYSNPSNTVANTTLDFFSMIPLSDTGISPGDYSIKIRISIPEHTYNKNVETSTSTNGRFQKGNVDFLEMSVSNFGFILYEEE